MSSNGPNWAAPSVNCSLAVVWCEPQSVKTTVAFGWPNWFPEEYMETHKKTRTHTFLISYGTLIEAEMCCRPGPRLHPQWGVAQAQTARPPRARPNFSITWSFCLRKWFWHSANDKHNTFPRIHLGWRMLFLSPCRGVVVLKPFASLSKWLTGWQLRWPTCFAERFGPLTKCQWPFTKHQSILPTNEYFWYRMIEWIVSCKAQHLSSTKHTPYRDKHAKHPLSDW